MRETRLFRKDKGASQAFRRKLIEAIEVALERFDSRSVADLLGLTAAGVDSLRNELDKWSTEDLIEIAESLELLPEHVIDRLGVTMREQVGIWEPVMNIPAFIATTQKAEYVIPLELKGRSAASCWADEWMKAELDRYMCDENRAKQVQEAHNKFLQNINS